MSGRHQWSIMYTLLICTSLSLRIIFMRLECVKLMCTCEALKQSLCVIHLWISGISMCTFEELSSHAVFNGPLKQRGHFRIQCVIFGKLQKHIGRVSLRVLSVTLIFPWKSPSKVFSKSWNHSNSSKIQITHECFLLLLHSWGIPEAKKKAQTHTHTHSLRTLGQIPVLSGCCGTFELSKPHHNPSHGSGCSVKSQFTVRLCLRFTVT